MGILSKLTMDNPLCSDFVFYGTLVAGKMVFMSALTVYRRVSNQVFSTDEDVKAFGDKGCKINLGNELVERVRRNHMNDIENITPFLILGVFYIMTDPDPRVAVNHFRVFAISRFLHTLAYQVPLPQPTRLLAFLTGLGVNTSMVAQILMATL